MPRSAPGKPVEIVYYPKKRATVPTRRANTVETVITDELDGDGKRPRKGRRTLTDETIDPSEHAFSELTRLGHAAFQAGRVDEARVVFESLVALGRRDAFAHTMLGTIFLGSQALEPALEQFDAALAIDPADLAATVYRGEILLSKRKVARAVQDLERALTMAPASDPFVARAKKLLGLARANR